LHLAIQLSGTADISQ